MSRDNIPAMLPLRKFIVIVLLILGVPLQSFALVHTNCMTMNMSVLAPNTGSASSDTKGSSDTSATSATAMATTSATAMANMADMHGMHDMAPDAATASPTATAADAPCMQDHQHKTSMCPLCGVHCASYAAMPLHVSLFQGRTLITRQAGPAIAGHAHFVTGGIERPPRFIGSF